MSRKVSPSKKSGKGTPDGGRISAEIALAKAAFEAATTREDRQVVKKGKDIVAVVQVPSQNWVSPVSAYLATLTEAKRIAKSGSNKSQDVPSEGNDQVLAALAEGRAVIGISQIPERFLPSALIVAADICINIRQPDATVVMRAMALCLRGRNPKNVPREVGTGLDFPELAAALRPGWTPARALKRLVRASVSASAPDVSKGRLPDLKEAVFYGEAREWGLALAADVTEAKVTGDWSGVDRGAVFFGEPGTGKTWLARLIARACRLPIVESSVADLFGSSAGFLDSVIKAQRAVFAKAAAAAPCILFWDEIEAMPNRAELSPRARDWWMPVVDDFLLLVSSTPHNVILLGATNHVELVDRALLRPGRMERAIEIKAPRTAEGLETVLRFHLAGELEGENIRDLASMGLGATAAAAMGWIRRARRTARIAKRKMLREDLAAVIAPPDDRPLPIRRQTAIHEAAHAVVTQFLGAEELHSVSIIRTEDGGGHMKVGTGDAQGARGRQHYENVAIGTLAGRAAEVVLCDGATAGGGGHPNSDLAIATRVVAAMHASLGLGDSLLYRGEPGSLDQALMYDPKLRATVDADMKRLHACAEDLVRKHSEAIEAVAAALLKHRHLDAGQVKKIVAHAKGISGSRLPMVHPS